MESSECSNIPVAGEKGPTRCRRVWTKEEEAVLIEALKELKSRGWKADNSFKVGYLRELEALIRKRWPNTDLRGDPQIKSKLTVWKKTYGQVLGIANTSGLGWSDANNSPVIESEEVWTSYIKVHPEVSGHRNKKFPYYDAWVEVFGKDRATGEGVEDTGAAVQEILAEARAIYGGSRSKDVPMSLDSGSSNDENGTNKSAVSTKSNKGKNKRKRSFGDGNGENIGDIMRSCMRETNEQVKELADSFKSGEIAGGSRNNLYDALAEIAFLTDEERIFVGHRLIHDKDELDFFFQMPVSAREKFVDFIVKDLFK